jgi:hypothetical protein
MPPLLHAFYGGEGWGEEVILMNLLPLTPSSIKSMEEGGWVLAKTGGFYPSHSYLIIV